NAQESVQRMLLVDQRGVLGACCLDKCAGGDPTACVHRHSDDLEPHSVELLSPLLPHGQVKPAPSPRCPCEQEDLAPAKGVDGERSALPLGQGDWRQLGGGECPASGV